MALAAFRGPVVNRPDERGYFPLITRSNLGAHRFGVERLGSILSSHAASTVANSAALLAQEGAGMYREVHGTRERAGGTTVRYCSQGRIGRVLVAGWRAFPLDDVQWPVIPQPPRATPLFSVLTLAHGDTGTCLIRADPIPRWEDYAALADRVHGALLEALSA